MDTRAFTTTLSSAALALLTLTQTTFAAAGQSPAEPKAPARPSSKDGVRDFHDAEGDYLRLPSGYEYKLTRLPESVRKEVEANAARVDAAQQQGRKTTFGAPAGTATPEIVDNRRFHGPIREQAGRGTCTSFATVAALEGAYPR